MKHGRVHKLSSLIAALAIAISLSLTFPPQAARAQSADGRGAVSGTVKDSSGANVVGAKVFLISVQQAVLNTTETDAEGRFNFAAVSAGSYEVRISGRGFDNRRVAAKVSPGETTDVPVVLEINALTEEITVTAETGIAEDRARVPQSVNVISESNIQQRATAVLAQVADEEVGVSLQRTSPTIGSVLVRGLTEVGVYVDGVRYTNSTQRGGINTFFNLNDPTSLRAVEVLRGPNTAQYGSDGLGGTVQLVSRQPEFGYDRPEWHGEFNNFFTSADLSYGSNALMTYGTKRFGLLANVMGRRANTLRPGGGIDSHSAITRFLGLPSNITGENRLTDTAFTQYGGTLHLNYAPTDDQQFIFRYQRGQQDGGKRYDQTLGGDGNLIADLRNLMLDFGYVRYLKQGLGFFDNLSSTVSYNSQREERVNQGGQGNPLAAITHDKERTSTVGFSFFMDKQFGKRNNFVLGGDLYRDHVDAPSFTFQPTSPANPDAGTVTLTRPRVPNGARYILGGIYVQDAHELIRQRLRLSGALRYNIASYRS
ncbi:MAG TPA: TonB-dependent receptor plug domain-containing protein, partial [Pyrinomonadaceae bacterium]